MDNEKIETPKNNTNTSVNPQGASEKSNKELQEELVSLGMPAEDASKITTKSVLLSVINTLKAGKATEKVELEQDIVNPTEERKVTENWKTKAHKQWDLWNSSKMVRTMVPLSGQEKQGVIRWVNHPKMKIQVPVFVSGAVQTVIENGAQYLVPKGVMVDVPEPVAKIIEAKFRQTSEAGRDILADRIDPETGRAVADRL